MLRLFLASLLPSLIALPCLALSLARPAPARYDHAPNPDEEPPAAIVVIQDGAFTPAIVTIAPGQVIEWDNRDGRDYSLLGWRKTADDTKSPSTEPAQHTDVFTSGTLKPGGAWSHEFTTLGTYSYGCQLHPRAAGSVEVRVEAESNGG